MRISSKLTLALSAAGLVLFGSYGLYLVRSESADLHNAVEREVRLLGRSLQVATANALRDRQLADVRETLEKLESIDPNVDIFIFDPAGTLTAASKGSEPEPAPDLSEPDLKLQYIPPEDAERLVLTVPLMSDARTRIGTLVVVRPLADVKRDLAQTSRGIALSVVFFAVVTWALGLFFGRLFITKPLERLVAAMGRVRSGDLTYALPVSSRDEAGAVAGQFNAMVADLHEARARLEQESESRQRLQRGLERVDKLITIGQLSAGLAHEIGTPLQILHGRARALLARAHDPEGTRRNAEILVEQSERITRIVEQLLRFSRHRTTHALPMQLPAAVQSVLDLLGVEARRRGLRLTLDVAPDLPEVEADPDQVQQIVLNLMTNAFAATPNGGSVEVRLETGAFSRADGSSARSARLIVRDTGCGIPAEIRERLFEPFFTTRDAEGGTGLGLSVVRAIVTEHRGAISVESELGAGATFMVDLPERSPRDRALSTEDR